MEPIRYIVESGSADGIILNQTQPNDPRIEYLQELAFPFATHGRSDSEKPHNYYDFDHLEFGRLTLETLRQRERKSVVLIAARQRFSYARDLLLGANEVAAEHGMTVRLLDNVYASESMGNIEAALNFHFEQYPDTDAILSTTFTGAMAAISVFDEKRVVIGKEVDLMVREFIPMLQRFRPGTLSVTENVELAGDFLAKAILQAIDFPAAPVRQYLETPLLTLPHGSSS